MRNTFVIFCVLATVQISTNDAPPTHLQENKTRGNTALFGLIQTTQNTLTKLWARLSDTNNINEKILTQSELLNMFIDLHDSLQNVEKGINDRNFDLFKSMLTYAQTDAYVKSINSYYDAFRRLQDEIKQGKSHSQLTWTDLAETYLQENDFGLVKIMDKLHHHVTDSNPINLFQLTLQEIRTICDVTESPHQILYNLYNSVSVADLKGYIMLQFSYMILKLYDKGNYEAESQRERAKFEKRWEEKSKTIRNVLVNADRSVYNCDPTQYVEGVNYVKLTKLLQGYIENEVNLNPYGTCRENCAFYVYTTYHGCYKEQFCSKQPSCRGKVIECKYVDSDMNICKSSDPERRYDWIEYESGKVLGNKGKCLARNFHKVDSWWRYLFWHCSYCMCLCDEGSYSSDRYFNLREVTSDIAENKVITGVRIIKHNRIIHFQIQQGVLGQRGIIDKSTISWKPVDNYTITDKNVHSGIDYHTMNWLDRIIDIDEIYGDSEQVLTGVRFRKLGHHLNMEIRVTPINFTSGEIFHGIYSTWLSNDNTEASLQKPRKEIVLTNPDIPIRYRDHALDSEHDNYIKFQASSFDFDAAQGTVPYLDAQPLISHGFLLSGMGLVHRGKPGSGGFIAPKLISYDYSQYVEPIIAKANMGSNT